MAQLDESIFSSSSNYQIPSQHLNEISEMGKGPHLQNPGRQSTAIKEPHYLKDKKINRFRWPTPNLGGPTVPDGPP